MSAEELQAASERVASRNALWSQFVRELEKLGKVRLLDAEVQLVVGRETAAHRFVVTSDSLRSALVHAYAVRMRSGSDVPRMLRLPGWFLADLAELIGSSEEPVDEPFVQVGQRAQLQRSARADPLPLRATYEPPCLTDFAPEGYWRTSHDERFDDGSG